MSRSPRNEATTIGLLAAIVLGIILVYKRLARITESPVSEKLSRDIVLNNLVADTARLNKSHSLGISGHDQSTVLLKRENPVSRDPNTLRRAFFNSFQSILNSDDVGHDEAGLALDSEVINLDKAFRGVDHNSSPVVADAEAATSVDPALTVQENASGTTPAASERGADNTSAPLPPHPAHLLTRGCHMKRIWNGGSSSDYTFAYQCTCGHVERGFSRASFARAAFEEHAKKATS